jgi:hypothetical protein
VDKVGARPRFFLFVDLPSKERFIFLFDEIYPLHRRYFYELFFWSIVKDDSSEVYYGWDEKKCSNGAFTRHSGD